MTMTAEMTTTIVRRKVADLKPHPANPRKLDQKSPDVKEMEQSIKQHGLMQLPAIDENDNILAGERRWRALKNLGWTEVDCVVLRGLDAAEAVLALLAANTSVQAHDPFLQSNAINQMLKDGITVQRIADKLGKTTRWVAQHSALSGLDKAVRKLWDDGALVGWDANMLAAIAVLSKDDQRELCPQSPGNWSHITSVHTPEELDALIGGLTQSLGKAPWDVADATLLPKAGACTTCPLQSMRQPGLFDDGKCTNIKEARCLSPGCWDAKLAITAQRKAAALGDGAKVIVDEPDIQAKIPGAIRDYEVSIVPKDSSNSEKAILVSGGTIKSISIAKFREPKVKAAEKKAKGADAPEKDAKQRYADSIDQIARRRKAFVVDKVRDLLAQIDAPETNVVMTLVATFGCRSHETHHHGADFVKLGESFKSNADWSIEVYRRVVPLAQEALKRWNPSNLDSEAALASWLCRKLQLNEDLYHRQAEGEIPDPKWWAAYAKKEQKTVAEQAEAKVVDAKPVKKAKAGKAKAKAKKKKKA